MELIILCLDLADVLQTPVDESTAAMIEYHHEYRVVGTIAPAIKEDDEGILTGSPLDKRRSSRTE